MPKEKKSPINTKEKDVTTIVPDTSILIEGILSQKIQNKELKPKTIYIHEAVLAELEAQANKNREVGFDGLEEITKLKEVSKKSKINLEFKGQRPGDFEIKYAKAGEIDSIIRELARKENATLLTADRVQSLVAESKGISVIFIEFEEVEEKEVSLSKYFDKNTMSVHLKENCYPMAKKGKPGSWKYQKISEELLDKEYLSELSKIIIQEAKSRDDSFIETDKRGSTILQISNYRIVITRPNFSDGYEITAVRPVKKLDIKDYKLPKKLIERIETRSEGILIAGAPGHGKSTFSQALAEHYLKKNKVVKTVEAPRDLDLPESITQYSINNSGTNEIHDILLLSRPDYTIFDEMRNSSDFSLFADLRLSGVGMVGVIHGTKTIDAIQRFIGKIELGVIPHVVDTVIFIRDGKIDEIFSISMEVKVPSGMFESDLARPIVIVNDFDTGKLVFEIYTYGEQTIVVPVKHARKGPAIELAIKSIKQEVSKHIEKFEIDLLNDNKCIIYVEKGKRTELVGKDGKNIAKVESKLGLNIDVREREFSTKSLGTKKINYDVSINQKNIHFILAIKNADKDVHVYVDDNFILTAKSSKKGDIKIAKDSGPAKSIIDAVEGKGKLLLKV